MPDEKPPNSRASATPDVRASLLEAWEVIGALEEKITDLDLQVSSALIALARTLPEFAREFERARSTAAGEKRETENGPIPHD